VWPGLEIDSGAEVREPSGRLEGGEFLDRFVDLPLSHEVIH
jgi:hypothetical protein